MSKLESYQVWFAICNIEKEKAENGKARAGKIWKSRGWRILKKVRTRVYTKYIRFFFCFHKKRSKEPSKFCCFF